MTGQILAVPLTWPAGAGPPLPLGEDWAITFLRLLDITSLQ